MSIEIVCVAFVLFSYWSGIAHFFLEHFQLQKLPKLPFPHYPVLGHLLSFPRDANKFFWTFQKKCMELATTTNNKIGVFWVLMKPNILVIHPDSAEVILKSTTNIRKSQNYDYLRPWLHDGLITSTGQKWRKRRKIITPSFHFDILKDFHHIMNEHTSVFIDSIDKVLSDGGKVDIQLHMDLLTLDIICETAMGYKLHAQNSKENYDYVLAVQRMGEFFHKRITNPWLRSDFVFNLTASGREQKKCLKVFHGLSRGVVDKRLAEVRKNNQPLPKRKVFLDLLMTAQAEDGSSLTADDIQEEVDTFMVAGHDSSTNVFSWAIYILGRYPDKQRKLQEELDSVFGDDKKCDITFDHIKDLTYLDLVVKESFRMYPSAPFIARSLDEDCVVDGMILPKGQDVTLNIYQIHRHPDIWEEPNKFIPERFEAENREKANIPPYGYIPFSAGPRNCIGQRFAVQSEKVILAKFFRQFSVVSYDKEEDIKISPDVVFQIDQKLNIKVTKRNV